MCVMRAYQSEVFIYLDLYALFYPILIKIDPLELKII